MATNDTYTTPENTTLTVTAPGLLANDSDPSGKPLTAALVAGPANGTLTLNPNGSFSYTPNAGFYSADSFTYRDSDGTLQSNTATVALTVTQPLAPPPTAPTNTSAGNPGLVAAYPFDEGTGTTVHDVSGNGNNGTISNVTWTTAGKYGDALVFNGTNALVTINDSSSLHLTTGMTLEAWVNPSTVTSAWRDVVYKGNDNYYLEATSSYNKVPVGGGQVGSPPSYAEAKGTAALPTNTWSFLSATYDGTTMRIYVNGTQVGTQAETGSLLTSTNPLQIGGDSIFGQYFAGLIDEVRVYNVALTAAQIQSDMNTPIGTGGNTQPPTAPTNLSATTTSAAGATTTASAAGATTTSAVVASAVPLTADPKSVPAGPMALAKSRRGPITSQQTRYHSRPPVKPVIPSTKLMPTWRSLLFT